MIIYVSSPYAAVLKCVDNKGEAMRLIHKYANIGSLAVKEMGYTPLSPVLCFDRVYDESCERDKAIQSSLNLLEACQGIMIVRTPYSEYSSGMRMEINRAEELGLSVYEIDA